MGLNHPHEELPTAQQTKTVVDPKASQRKHYYYINNDIYNSKLLEDSAEIRSLTQLQVR
jgi:hypothetical protein